MRPGDARLARGTLAKAFQVIVGNTKTTPVTANHGSINTPSMPQVEKGIHVQNVDVSTPIAALPQ